MVYNHMTDELNLSQAMGSLVSCETPYAPWVSFGKKKKNASRPFDFKIRKSNYYDRLRYDENITLDKIKKI